MQLVPIPPHHPQTRPTQREAWIEQYHRSGLSCRAFTQANGLNLSTFYGWLKKARRPPASNPRPVVFQELPSLSPVTSPVHPWAMEIETAAGLRIRLR
jgi:hypothetical protein